MRHGAKQDSVASRGVGAEGVSNAMGREGGTCGQKACFMMKYCRGTDPRQMGSDARDSPCLPSLPAVRSASVRVRPFLLRVHIALLSSWLPAGSHKPLSLFPPPSSFILYLPVSSQPPSRTFVPSFAPPRSSCRCMVSSEFPISDFFPSPSPSSVVVVPSAAGLCPGPVGIGGSELGGEEEERCQECAATAAVNDVAGAGDGKIRATDRPKKLPFASFFLSFFTSAFDLPFLI